MSIFEEYGAFKTVLGDVCSLPKYNIVMEKSQKKTVTDFHSFMIFVFQVPCGGINL